VSNTQIAAQVGVTRQTVVSWRARYARSGIAGLHDEARPRTIDHEAIITETLKPPPNKLGVTHWSRRLLAQRLGVDATTVARAWRANAVAPWRAETFKFSTDSDLAAKVTDVVGLYLAPPENAIVLCVDETCQVQALDRTTPILAMQPGLADRRSHDYVRHGTTTLFAAWEIATGKVTAAVKQRHRHQEFLAFLKRLVNAYPHREPRLVMDNYAAHERVEGRDWLAANERVKIHFTPTSGSWLNLVEVWFAIIERQAIRRGTLRARAARRVDEAWPGSCRRGLPARPGHHCRLAAAPPRTRRCRLAFGHRGVDRCVVCRADPYVVEGGGLGEAVRAAFAGGVAGIGLRVAGSCVNSGRRIPRPCADRRIRSTSFARIPGVKRGQTIKASALVRWSP
jgi:transposase